MSVLVNTLMLTALHKRVLLYASGVLSTLFALWYVFTTGEWHWLIWLLIYETITTTITNDIGLHRYFSHGSFKTGPIRRFLLVWLSILPGTGSVINWSSLHRHHHNHADKERDVHSPHASILGSMNFFQFNSEKWFENKDINFMHKDLLRDPMLQLNHKYYFTAWLVLILVLLIVSWKLLFLIVLPGMFLMNLNSGIVINTLSHLKIPGSYRNYETPDRSYNNKYLTLISQQALHNNHHAHPRDYNQAKFPGEFDLAAWFIKTFLKTND
jgi:stearoyl-CoA desaturase (Delta-9 desaturase)